MFHRIVFVGSHVCVLILYIYTAGGNNEASPETKLIAPAYEQELGHAKI